MELVATPRARRRVRRRNVVLAIVVTWLAVGAIRAPVVARDAFAQAHGNGVTVRDVQVTGVIPLVPPFWGVAIDGDVVEPGATQAYRSAMLLCLEPVTGFVIRCGAG